MPIESGSSVVASSLAGFEIGYDQITAPVNVASTTEATGTTIISCAAHTFDGAPVLLTVYFPYIENGTAAAADVTVCLFEGATQLGRLGIFGPASGTLQEVCAFCAQYRFTPSAASHTYTITAFANTTTGTPQIGADVTGTGHYMPGFARFTKV